MTRSLSLRLWQFVVTGAVLLCGCSSLPGLTLVEDGQPRAALVLSKEAAAKEVPKLTWSEDRPDDPLLFEKLAAVEIQEHVKRISGATLPILAVGPDVEPDMKGLAPIFIGRAADERRADSIRPKGTDPASFLIDVQKDRASIVGLSAEGTLFGAYELLEQLGVRWFLPGELGLVVPQARTVTVKAQTTIQVPSFPARRLQAVRAPQWEMRVRLGGLYFPASHGVPGMAGRQADKLFEEHPEWFSLIDGVRKNRQLCVSNPEVVKYAIEQTKAWFRAHPNVEMIGMGANDGRNFCQCEKCKALDADDYDPFGHSASMTDRYVWLITRILEGIADEFPDKRIGFYAYSVYNRPPVKTTPSPRIVPAVALITLCRIHGMDNPICSEKNHEIWTIQEWRKRVPEVYYRGYWFNLADPGLPFFMISRIAREVPLGKKLGITGWRVEAPYEWSANTPSLYLAAKLMWDHTADVGALMKDFYEKFAGPAAGQIQAYIELMDGARRDADYHTGSSWDIPHIYDATVRAAARGHLEEAARRVPADSVYAKRVWMYRKSLDYLDAFVEMLETRARFDFAASKQALDRTQAIREELEAHDPPLIGRKAKDYMNRFFTKTVQQGYERTTGGNELVAGLADEWLFQIDPERVGEDIGWWRPEAGGRSWRPIKTSSSTWSNQGLRYYKGLAWYRQTVHVPEKFKDKERFFLWFGAIDELAKVWVNGKAIGISPKITFTPFELDATDAVQVGADNVVVVCVQNETINELGTGGIMGPVMFYAPAAGKEAQPFNLKEPSKTFPEY